MKVLKIKENRQKLKNPMKYKLNSKIPREKKKQIKHLKIHLPLNKCQQSVNLNLRVQRLWNHKLKISKLKPN